MNRKLAAVAAALLVAGAMAGTVLAAGPNVPTVTGCLASKDAALIKVKLGDQPSSPCSTGQTLIRLSGGDLTSISAGAGLTGGGTNGDITIGLDTSFTLPQDCVAGDVVEKTSSGWSCGDDDDTTYTAGSGLDLSATNELSVEPDNVVINNESCQSGQYVSGIGSDGHIDCAALPSAGSIASYTRSSTDYIELAGTQTIMSLSLPAGRYVVHAIVNYLNIDSDSSSLIDCWLPNSLATRATPTAREEGSLPVQSYFTGGGIALSLVCKEGAANVDIAGVTMTATEVDSLN